MTDEKILTDDTIHNLIVDFEIECDCGIETTPVDNIVPFTRAIEQAVLQSSEVQAWKRDAERLTFACEFDAYTTVSKDRYDYAIECAEEAGRDEPTKEDELNGLRRLIDAAIDHTVAAENREGA